MSKAEFGAAVGVAAGLDESQKQRITSLELQVGTVDVGALEQRVTNHDAEINELQARPSGGGANGSIFSILSGIAASLNFVPNPTEIAIQLTSDYQTVFNAETSQLTITAIPSGTVATDFDFTSNQNKEFTARLTISTGATTLYSLEKDIPAGESSIVMSAVFGQKTFTSGDTVKFKLELRSPHAQTITFYPATEGVEKNLHVHTPIVIDTVNSAVQTALNTKANDNAVVHLAGAETITGAKTFSGTVTLSSLTALQRLELDANKNLSSVSKGSADNKNYSTTAADIKMNGTQALGTSDTLPRADHVHPSDTTKANTTDFRQESTLFVEQTYGLDTNAGTTLNKPFKTVSQAWTDINPSGQIKVMGSATYNETHTFDAAKTSIKTTLDEGAKITGTVGLVAGNTSMYFSGGMFGATLNDDSTGTTYFENINVGGATFNFSNGGYKVIRGSSSAPLKINLTGVAGILYLENISGGNISIDIGIGWVVFINGVQLNVGVRLGTVIEGVLISAIIADQPALDALVATPNANGYYVVNFGSQQEPPVIKNNDGQVILTLQEGDVIYKIGTNHQLVYTMQSAPSSLSLLTGINQATALCKNNTRWVRLDAINTNISNIQTQVNGRSNVIVVDSEAERKALAFGTGLEQVSNGTLVLQRNGGGATPFVFNGGDSQDVAANANWITANTNAIPSINPIARMILGIGQSNGTGYSVLDANNLDDSPTVSDNVDVMASRCLLSNSTEDTGLFYTVNVTANGTTRVTITNTNYVYAFKKNQRVYGINVPANTYITVADVNNDFTTIEFNNVIPNTVTSINFSRIEGAPIKLQAFNNSGRRTLPAYRIGNPNGSGVAYFFAKGNIDQNFQENSNDVVCIISPINGSTGFANNGAWVANTGYLAQETIRLYAAAKEYYESQGFNVTLSGGLFCLGEEDSRQGTTTAAMQTFLQDLITYFKNNCPSSTGLSAKAPIWLFNGLHSYWLNSTLGYSRGEIIPLNQKFAIDNAFRNMPQLVEGATYIAFPTQNKDYTQADCIHVTVPAAKKQAKRLINALQKAKQNTADSPSEAPENLTVNGVQETGALATWDALFGQKYDLEWKFNNQDWAVATRVNDLTTASYSVPADSGTTIDVRVRAKKQNGTGTSGWATVTNTTLNSTIQNQMTVRFTAGINSDANFVLTDSLGNLNATLQTGAKHISKWLNEVQGQRHAESLIMGTSGFTTTITLTAGSNIATLANATGVTANTNNKTYVDIVSTVVGGVKHSDYSILPRDTLITAVNGTQITMSNPAPAVVDAGGYNVRLRYNRTLTQAGGALTQVGGNRQGHPVRSKILNNKNQWLHCLNLQSENNGLVVDDLLDGNFSYSGTVLFRHTAYNTLAAVAGSGLTLIANTTTYGGNVGLDTGSRNYLSRIVEQNLTKLSTLWRTGNLRITVNHNSTTGGAIDTTDILADRWYMFTVTFDRVAGLIKLYRNGVFVAQFTNTTALTAFQGYIGCIELSNGFRAGAVGANIAAVYYHKRELAATEVASLKTFLTNKFSVTLG